jgi:hypothetical protein
MFGPALAARFPTAIDFPNGHGVMLLVRERAGPRTPQSRGAGGAGTA